MPSGKKQPTKSVDKRTRIPKDLYEFRKCVDSGFPSKCSAIAYDERLKLIAIGTKNGSIKIYGQPGVEFVGQHADNAEVQKLLFVPEQARLLAFCADSTVHLWELNFTNLGQGTLEEVRCVALTDADRKLIEVSAFCLSYDTRTLFVGSTSGIVYLLNLPELTVSDAPLRPDVLLAGLPRKHQVSPGSVEGLAINPQNTDQLLVAYSHGLVVTCPVSNGTVMQADAAYHSDVSVQSMSLHRDGNQVVTAHEDGSYVYWHLHPDAGSSDEEASDDENNGAQHVRVMKLKKKPKVPYGPNECKPIQKVVVKSSDKGDILILIGGMPRANYSDKFTVSVISDSQHVVYDLTSKVIDFVVVDSHELLLQNDNPDLLIILAEEELVAIDLQSDKWQQTPTPYMTTIHSSAITFSAHFPNVDARLWSKMHAVGEAQLRRFNYSIRAWPVNGGCLLPSDAQYCARDIFVTGHESGAVNFWDASSLGSLSWLCKLSTAKLFKGEFADALDSHVEELEPDSPPFRKVGTYDPYSDDPRLAIQKVVLCSEQLAVAVAGAAGQVMIFQLNENDRENVLPIQDRDVVKCNIVENSDKFTWKGWEALPVRDSEVDLPAGFHPSLLIELNPPAAISAMDFSAAWNVLAVGTAHGFAIVDVTLHKPLVTRCTLNLADELARLAAQAGPMQRMRSSLKKSLRQSVRRMRRARDSVRRSMRRKGTGNNAATEKKGRMTKAGGKEKVLRSQSAAESKPAADAGIEQKEVNTALIRTVLLADTYVNSSSQRLPTAFIGTNGGVAFIYSLTPSSSTGGRASGPFKCDLKKQLQLQHKAAMMHLAVLRAADMSLVGTSDPTGPQVQQHELLVVSEEQLKLFSLPNLKPKCKVKITEADGQLVRKATVAQFRARQNDVTVNAPVVLTNTGELRVFYLDSHAIRAEFSSPCIKEQDAVGINSCFLTRYAHGYYHSSPSEFMRFSASQRNQQTPHCSVAIAESGRVVKNLGRPASIALSHVASPISPRVSAVPANLASPASPTPVKQYASANASATPPTAQLTINTQSAPKTHSAPLAGLSSPNHGDEQAAVYYSMPPDLPPKARTSVKATAEPPKLLATVGNQHHRNEEEEEEEEEDGEEEEEESDEGEASFHPPPPAHVNATAAHHQTAKAPGLAVHVAAPTLAVHAGVAVNNGAPHNNEDEEEEEDDDDV